jgi:hypothetical protein
MNKIARAASALIICVGVVTGIVALSGSSSTTALITAGPSRNVCLYPLSTNGDLEPGLSNAETATGVSVSCVSAYLNGALTWSQWENPWIIAEPQKGYTAWVAAEPQRRQLILQVDLIPGSLQDQYDPLAWEKSCANGQFDSYAKQLGKNLVSAGLGHSVIRLGAEMNGSWESDYVGTTTYEQNMWAKCFAQEVTSLRQATGEDFLIDWNPNSCTENIPYSNFYPGNAYVDILGLDLYDGICTVSSQSTKHITWGQLAHEPAGLASFEAFAKANKKPMSLPEWGLLQDPNGDDPAFIDGIGSTVTRGDFAFESYFDAGDGATLQLGSSTPRSVVAFQKWFGSSSK